ncbi:MAG TPA: hypothetical protein VLG74_02315 [Blastocatellia bacterium]|nr:hypothetical protein [Blastocatellia bacterium]
MSKHPIGTTARPSHLVENENSLWTRLDGILDGPNLALMAFLIGVIVMVLYKPFDRPEGGDPAIYDYLAQSILRGQLPYRDVVDIKGPGAPYLSAAAIAVGRLFDIRDILSIRALHVVMVGLLSAFTFLVAHTYLESRLAAVIAFVIPLLRESIVTTLIGGTQPKLPMIIFGLLTLLMIAKDRPMAAGFFSMLSCLCWQPGLLFTGTALLIFSRYFTNWRDLKALKVLASAFIPLVIVLGYFYSRGALGDLWAWTITYNYSVFGPDAGPTPGDAIRHIVLISRRVFEREIVIIMLSAIGLGVFLFERVRKRISGAAALESPDLFRDALIFPPLIYGAFTLVNFQGPPDLIPLMPFLGIFAGWLFVWFGRAAGRLTPPSLSSRSLAGQIIGIAVPVAILAVVLVRAGSFRVGGLKLKDQHTGVQRLREELQPGDEIYVHGAVEILVLLNKANLNPYIFLDWGADEFEASRRGVSFQQLVDEMETRAPKYVALTRVRKVYHRKELEQWVDSHYQPLVLLPFRGLYVRR